MPRDIAGRAGPNLRRLAVPPAVLRTIRRGLPLAILTGLAACAPDYSPDVYNANAVQQANKVEPGVVVGFRQVEISANGTVGAVTGGAVGGILGSQTGEFGFNTAIGAVGGSAVGGMVGNAITHVAGDTVGWEYIVRKANGDLLSVTQREPSPIPIGQKVLVITGPQARIIRDYSVDPPPAPVETPAATRAAVVPPHTPAPAAPPSNSVTLGAPPAAAVSSPLAPDAPAAAETVPTVSAPADASAEPAAASAAVAPSSPAAASPSAGDGSEPAAAPVEPPPSSPPLPVDGAPGQPALP